MTLPRGGLQRRTTFHIACIRVDAVVQQQSCYVAVSVPGSGMQGRATLGISAHRVCTGMKEPRGCLQLALDSQRVQGLSLIHI